MSRIVKLLFVILRFENYDSIFTYRQNVNYSHFVYKSTYFVYKFCIHVARPEKPRWEVIQSDLYPRCTMAVLQNSA